MQFPKELRRAGVTELDLGGDTSMKCSSRRNCDSGSVVVSKSAE